MLRNSKFDSENTLSKKQRNILTAEFTLDTYGNEEDSSSSERSIETTNKDGRRQSIVSQYARKTIMSLIGVSKVHQHKLGSDNMRQRELERIIDAPFVIHPYSNFRLIFDAITTIVLILNLIFVPIIMTYPKFDSIYLMVRPDQVYPFISFILMFVSDIWFTLDIMMNFRTGYIEADTAILNVAKIRKKYIRGWFWFDLIATIPFDQVAGVLTQTDIYASSERMIRSSGISVEARQEANIDIIRYFKLIRLTKVAGLLRLIRLTKLFRNFQDVNSNWINIESVKGIGKIFSFILLLFVWIHLAGCFQFMIPTLNPAYPYFKSWSVASGLNKDTVSWSIQYTKSLFRSLSHMFCIGYGTMAPQCIDDLWMMFFSILIGDLLKAVFIGVASSMMQMMDASRRLYMEKLNTVTEYMEFKKLPSYTRGRLLEYYENRYQGKMFDEEKVLATLNPILRRALVRHNRKDLVKKVPFFDDCPSHFIDEILNVMRLEMYLKNDKIIRQGTTGQKMFFIQSGICLIILGNRIKRKRKSLALRDGDFFGEISLLIPDTKRTATVIARETTYVYSLKHHDFSKILDSYPTVKEKMELIAEERLAETQKAECALTSSDSEPDEDESKVFPWPSYNTYETEEYESFETPILTVNTESNTSVPVFTFNLETPSDEKVQHTSESV